MSEMRDGNMMATGPIFDPVFNNAASNEDDVPWLHPNLEAQMLHVHMPTLEVPEQC